MNPWITSGRGSSGQSHFPAGGGTSSESPVGLGDPDGVAEEPEPDSEEPERDAEEPEDVAEEPEGVWEEEVATTVDEGERVAPGRGMD